MATNLSLVNISDRNHFPLLSFLQLIDSVVREGDVNALSSILIHVICISYIPIKMCNEPKLIHSATAYMRFVGNV